MDLTCIKIFMKLVKMKLPLRLDFSCQRPTQKKILFGE